MRSFLKFLSVILPFFYAGKAVSQDSGKRPNIIIIMADDMGYSDIGCYGGEIKTPNIDWLASNGLRFTQFYNTSRCCPTRASLLTGLYNHRAGIGDMSFDQHLPGYRGYLTENTVTLAEVLRSAGYQTGMVGKWHVANTITKTPKQAQIDWLDHKTSYPEFGPLEQYPVNRGFDKYYGNIWGVVDFFDPFSLVNGTEPVKEVSSDYYHTDAINDTASAYIRQFSSKKTPFFLYVAHTAPHWPLHALPEDIKKYENVYKAGWDKIRNERYKKMLKEGIVSKEEGILSPRFAPGKDWETNPHKDWDAYAMAVRAAMVDRMDQGIGRIIKTLKETGELENTLIFFLSDNGASSDDAQLYGPGLDRPGSTRDGQKIVYPVDKKVLPGPQTTFASTDKMWSNVANAPFRYWKIKAYEGGTCTPLIAFWPEGLNVKKGSLTPVQGHVIDFMPTLIDLAGASYPKAFKGHEITPMQGISLAPVLKGEKIKGHDYLFFEHLGSRAVRHGDWKIVCLNSKSPWELYNLKNDRTETNNLARKYPEKVKALAAKWEEWAKANNVIPKPVRKK